MKAKQAVLVISGYNIRAVIAFCRWASAHGIDFHVIARNEADPVFRTKYKDRVAFIRTTPELCSEAFGEWARHLSQRHSYRRLLVLPSTEYLNRFLLGHRRTLEGEGYLIPLTDASLYATLSDKHSFARLCASYRLDIPGEFADLPAKVPFVAKPRRYLSGSGRQLIPQLVGTPHDLDRFRREGNPEDYFFQEHVPGRSLYLLAYLQKDGKDVLFAQENLMQQAHGGSIILAKRSDFHLTPTARSYVDMLHDLKFTGLIMIEVRRDESGGRHCMIEANPRLWGPIQFPIDNGVDLFEAMLADQGFAPAPAAVPPPLSEYYFWSGGIRPEFQPVTYHNYSCDQFVSNLPALWRNDLFFRQDTLELHTHELGMAPIRES